MKEINIKILARIAGALGLATEKVSEEVVVYSAAGDIETIEDAKATLLQDSMTEPVIDATVSRWNDLSLIQLKQAGDSQEFIRKAFDDSWPRSHPFFASLAKLLELSSGAQQILEVFELVPKDAMLKFKALDKVSASEGSLDSVRTLLLRTFGEGRWRQYENVAQQMVAHRMVQVASHPEEFRRILDGCDTVYTIGYDSRVWAMHRWDEASLAAVAAAQDEDAVVKAVSQSRRRSPVRYAAICRLADIYSA